MKKNNIVLTGGHAATTAVATIEAIKKNPKLKDFEIIWIGSSVAREGSKFQTLESKIMPSMGVKTLSINAGKLQTKFTPHTITSFLKIPIGFIQSFFLLNKIKPKVVLSFGGYASFPVVVWAWVFRIPVILHEQTVAAGRATLASTFFARKITLAREESLKLFPKNKSEVIGNPIHESILKVEPKEKIGNPPTILVMGGSRGSNFINELVSEIKDELIKKFKLIHITGEAEYELYKEEDNYKVLSSVEPSEMPNIYKTSDIIISRSGANSVSEIIYIKRPSILIPLPRTFMNEQGKNAQYAEEFGIAKALTETEATPQRVMSEINKIEKNWSEIVKNVESKNSPDVNASASLASILAAYI